MHLIDKDNLSIEAFVWTILYLFYRHFVQNLLDFANTMILLIDERIYYHTIIQT